MYIEARRISTKTACIPKNTSSTSSPAVRVEWGSELRCPLARSVPSSSTLHPPDLGLMYLVRPVGESQRSERDPHVRQGLVLRETLGSKGLDRSVDDGEGDLGDGELGMEVEGQRLLISESAEGVEGERDALSPARWLSSPPSRQPYRPIQGEGEYQISIRKTFGSRVKEGRGRTR